MPHKSLLIAGAVLLLGLALTACGGGATPAAETTPCPEAPACPECPSCPEPAVKNIPYEAAWSGSPHADSTAEAFNHWNEEDPAEIPVECATCHSTSGYQDFLGVDGSAAGVVDAAAPIGSVITCEACHNDATASLTSVVFPSGAEISGLGDSARCMICHQGRASTQTVDAKLAELGLTEDLDTPNADLGFINIHYFAAAATLFGAEARGGYEFAGQSYQPRFAHVEGYQECIDCHNPHTLELKIEQCSMCHVNVASEEDLKNIRMQGSLADYDGDGNMTEGIYYEVEGLRTMLYTAIQAYAKEVAGTPIVYDAHAYPYFFIDSNDNGAVDEGEAVFPNAYNAWTGRLEQAAYNYQVSTKDPGAFAHNAKYIIALLYDSIVSLNEALATPVDLSTAMRNDPGHFDGTAEAFRHWDEEGEVPGACSRCHTSEGLPFFAEQGVNISTEPSNAFMCSTCHTFEEGIQVLAFEQVTFPSGATLTLADNPEANLCMQCHQGRESTVSVNRAITAAGVGDDVVSEQLRFRNPHYFAAGATLFGAEAQGMYQYAGKTYAGRFPHVPAADACTECHNVHALTVNVEVCAGCHGSTEPETFRMATVDYDGDGDASEGIAGEIATMQEKLLAAIQAYSTETAGVAPIVYQSWYPYWVLESGETYNTWTPRLLRAAYNYQYAAKDPGAFTHNAKYVLQALYDSLQDIGGAEAVAGMTRP